VPPGRARRHRRRPVPGLLCRDPARSPPTRQQGRRASATGGGCACGDHRIADRTNNRQIGPSGVITAGRWHARGPVSPSDAAIRRHIGVAAPTAAVVPPPPPGQQIPQIPITSPAPRGFVHGRFPYAGLVPRHRLDGRRPKTFTMPVIRVRQPNPNSRRSLIIGAWPGLVGSYQSDRGLRRAGPDMHHFRPRRHLMSADRYRCARAKAFQIRQQEACVQIAV
jgi:hypothetical protein